MKHINQTVKISKLGYVGESPGEYSLLLSNYWDDLKSLQSPEVKIFRSLRKHFIEESKIKEFEPHGCIDIELKFNLSSIVDRIDELYGEGSLPGGDGNAKRYVLAVRDDFLRAAKEIEEIPDNWKD